MPGSHRGEERLYWDFGSGDGVAGFDERGVYVSVVRDSVFQAVDGIAMDCRDRAGVYVELSAQQLPAGAAVHSRDRNRTVWHGGRAGDVALGNLGDVDLALNGGRFANWTAADSLEQLAFQGFGISGGAGGCGASAVCGDFVSFARGI